MNLLKIFGPGDSAAAGLAILALAVTLGLLLGAIRVRGIKLGIPGVLFAALVFGQIGLTVDAKVLQFLRDFALIVFMYSIGLQVGPAFVSSLRAEGLRLNALAVAVLVLGALMSMVAGRALAKGAAPGLYTGAFTTTAGLAAAQEAVRRAPSAGEAHEVAAGRAAFVYSITYPFGVVGPVLVIIALRRTLRIRIEDERTALAATDEKRRPRMETATFEVTEPAQANQPLAGHPLIQSSKIILARMLRNGVLSVPTGQTQIQIGDVYRAVGSHDRLSELVSAMGRPSSIDLGSAAGDVRRMDLVVTRTQVLRRTLRELDLIRRTGATIVRVTRAGVDLYPSASLRLVFADRVIMVGPEAGLKMAEAELGNCPETLDHPQLVPIFLGIVLGVIVGSIPVACPGLHTVLRIGLAGGPLLAAIALSQLGNVGSIVWYMPTSANQLFRDFGLAVFLACVGLEAGNHFIQRAAESGGVTLMLWGAAITIVPVFVVGCLARLTMSINFITLSGWVAGAMTSSTSLLFANEQANSDAPAVAYAAVAPLATLVPIICAQLLALTAL